MPATIQDLCQLAHEQLTAMQYLQAESALVQAEALALEAGDWDSLARLYMPLQEVRRQRRQRCGEGVVLLDLVTRSADELLDVESLTSRYPHGQLLVAGWGSIDASVQFRSAAAHKQLYVETYLAAAYRLTDGTGAVLVVPTVEVAVPAAGECGSIDRLLKLAPPHSIVIPLADLPRGPRRGDSSTYAHTMRLWEKLHLPFLAMADQTTDPRLKIDGYRKAIGVDYACELAHQKLSDTARQLLKTGPQAR